MFAKAAWSPIAPLTLYGDLQYRTISYKANGVESHLAQVAIDEAFHFINPKAGISYVTKAGTLYASYGIAHREPIRDDYIDAKQGEKPKAESLGNLELGIRRSETRFQYMANFFLMNYVNQLVLTGEINDDGAYIRRNSGKSHRAGIELSGAVKPATLIELAGNISYIISKTDYRQLDGEGQMQIFDNKDISFSPRIVAGGQIRLFPVRNLELNWIMKYVGRQFLDNTGNDDLILDPYFINDARIAYLVTAKKLPAIEFTLVINNVFNTRYESNGYVYNNMPYYYPQAGTNFMAGVNVRF